MIGIFTPDDTYKLAAYRNLRDVALYQSWEQFTLADAEKLIQSLRSADPFALNQWYQLAIRIKQTGELIGDIGVRRFSNGPSKDAEIGFSLDPSFQKQGYMREALQSLIAWFAAPPNPVRRVVASVDPRNTNCLALLTALHFEQEAHHRQSYWFKGEWADDMIYVRRCE